MVTTSKKPRARAKAQGTKAKRAPPENRTGAGRFAPGTSGNPGGRPRLPEEFREHGPAAWGVIVGMMTEAEDEAVRLRAATWIAERLYGKPVQAVELTGSDEGPVAVTFVDDLRVVLAKG